MIDLAWFKDRTDIVRMAENVSHTPTQEGSENSEALFLYARSSGQDRPVEAAKPDKKPNALGKWFADLLTALIKTGVAFFLGYLLIQSVELDLKRAQFSADAADKLKTYVIELNSLESSANPARSKATALALGGFGGVAAYPLVQIVEHGNELQVGWGKLGLEQAGLIANDATCDVIIRVIDDPTRTFRWQTRKVAVETAGSVPCRAAAGPLQRLQQNPGIAGVPAGEQAVNFQKAIEKSLKQIARAQQRNRPWWKF